MDIALGWAIARRWRDETRRDAVEARQARWLHRLRRDVLPRSPFYASLADQPFETWPITDKAGWMAGFDRINTAGVRLADALAVAERAELSRDFRPTLNGLTVGLSTGTSGRRGVFLASGAERRRWAGAMLAHLLPRPLLKRRRVAFLLRAGGGLYAEAERSRLIDFRYFDLLTPLDQHLPALTAWRPDVLIAPPSVLRLLAEAQGAGALTIAPERLVSVAEVLEPEDRQAIAVFTAPLQEVYQATEGLLAISCAQGRLHLSEPSLILEREPLGDGRFTPVITDLMRTTQPVIRYRLDDVLVGLDGPCGCGRASTALDRVEGRRDDILTWLTADGAPVRVFPDFVSRAVLGVHPDVADFIARQPSAGRLILHLLAPGAEAAVAEALAVLAGRLGARPPSLTFAGWPPPPSAKRRRVRVDHSPSSS